MERRKWSSKKTKDRYRRDLLPSLKMATEAKQRNVPVLFMIKKIKAERPF